MELQSIHLQNYRCHEDLTVHFQPGFNVIAGVNGSGKTSLLKGVCDALGGLLHKKELNIQYDWSELNKSSHVKCVNFNGRYRYEKNYPIRISSNIIYKNQDIILLITKESELGKISIPRHGRFFIHNSLVSIFIFYRANRNWNQPAPTVLQAATQQDSQLDGYRNWSDASVDATNLQSWVIAKCLERFQTVSETGIPFDNFHDDELTLVNVALGDAMESFKGLRYDLKQKSLLVEWQFNPVTLFEHLSDGQRSVICLVADIARRMCLLNPQLGMEVTQQTPGIVLIDELDMHLHPQWQRILTNGLQKAFPKVQFIVASHSPQVLGELKPEQIILLRPEGTAHPQVSYGLTSSQVLEEIMGASERSGDVKKRLSELGSTLARNELPAARQHIADLEIEAPGIPELTGAKALLKRKEILGR